MNRMGEAALGFTRHVTEKGMTVAYHYSVDSITWLCHRCNKSLEASTLNKESRKELSAFKRRHRHKDEK